MKAKRTVELRFSVVTPMNMVPSENVEGGDLEITNGVEAINFEAAEGEKENIVVNGILKKEKA